ncbi:hypothetical protein HS961_07050 [Comamonas piscis]|uniref:Uncharacterized protein n=1 Tax=Comamonas piscis TaxID=1562974 RepID=A0A7G5EF40_9BURK|nr:hypothetical protein [Comamonas piscis]QMV72615.1 hypothetical protein HS961_07050 [Comamonas piscis]WSO35382.1 hypothetical protein VUJ63_07070 [Comamonas piscis]
MSNAHYTTVCTCPSGDGSMRWPCRVHPALFPCPFCGASASGYEIEPHQHSAAVLALVPDLPKEQKGGYVIEGDCQCGSGLIGDNQAQVTNRWNTRTSMQPQGVAIQDSVTLLRNEAARLERIYGRRGWYGFGDEKAAHIEHLRVADALAATAALPATVPGVLPEPETAIKEVMELVADLEREAADVGYGHGSQRLVNEKRAAIESKLRTQLAVPNATQAVQAEPVALQMCSELKPRTESEKAAYLAGVADGRMYAERDAAKQGLEASLRADKQDGEANG